MMLFGCIDSPGQEAFSVIHHLFISPYAVSVIVFSMHHVRENEDSCMRGIAQWVNSIIVHTLDEETNRMSPIVFVGTHKDTQPHPEFHGHISQRLFEVFGNSIAWNSVIPDMTSSLNFFPVDNTKGRDDDVVITRLMGVFEATLARAEYVNKLIPLTWLKCLDNIKATGSSYQLMQEVKRIATESGLHEDDLLPFLRFMHKVIY